MKRTAILNAQSALARFLPQPMKASSPANTTDVVRAINGILDIRAAMEEEAQNLHRDSPRSVQEALRILSS